jgi:hypothetical protein
MTMPKSNDLQETSCDALLEETGRLLLKQRMVTADATNTWQPVRYQPSKTGIVVDEHRPPFDGPPRPDSHQRQHYRSGLGARNPYRHSEWRRSRRFLLDHQRRRYL